MDRVDRATAERGTMRPFPAMLRALNELRKSTRYSSNRARKAAIHAGFGNEVSFEESCWPTYRKIRVDPGTNR